MSENAGTSTRITSYNVCYTKLLRARVDISRKVTEKGPKVYDSATVKKLAIIAGTETARNVLRIDEIVPKR